LARPEENQATGIFKVIGSFVAFFALDLGSWPKMANFCHT
jgi:hypothetical protein